MKSSQPFFSSKLPLLLSAAISLTPLAYAQDTAKAPDLKVDPAPLPPTSAFVSSFAPVVEKVSPSVVTISTSKMVRRQLSNNGNNGNPGLDNPMFRRFFGIPDQDDNSGNGDDSQNTRPGRGGQRKQAIGLGSGVIVSPDGHILTNNHVIEGADEILVTIGRDKREYKAKKIGTDEGSDLAVLKIEASNLSPVTFADSDKLRVGDLAIAVGNPFGLTQSVTLGIVSALGRSDTHITAYENFIQTDASINPGNSGGALVDAQGRLIGINTAIYSRTGGNQGIGFAVPSNQARSVMDAILKNGKVSRGFLGINLQDAEESLVADLKLPNSNGAVVSDVQPGSPAEKAGIQNSDFITEVNGKAVQSSHELQLFVGSLNPGEKVQIKLFRDGKDKTISAELGERPTSRIAANNRPDAQSEDPDVLDGVTVGDLDATARREFQIPETVRSGAVVTKIDPDSPSADAGIQTGDVIQDINRQPVTSAKDAVAMSEKVKKEKRVLLRVNSKGASRFVAVERKD